MLPPDAQRLEHMRDYCSEIEKTILRYGNSFEVFDNDPDYPTNSEPIQPGGFSGDQ